MLASMHTRPERVCRCLVVSLALLGWPLHSAHADSNAVGFDAGAIFPIDNHHVRLVSERVEIDLRANSGDAEQWGNATCVYVLRNLTGAAQTLHMAFVTNGSPMDMEEHFAGGIPDWFHVSQDGAPRSVRWYAVRPGEHVFENGEGADSLPVWSVTLAPRARSVIRMDYYAGWSHGKDGGDYFTYYTTPAARWAGRVQSASFILHLGDSACVARLQREAASWDVRIEPSSYRWTRDGLAWTFRDWKPDTNLHVALDYPTDDPARSPWSPDSVSRLPDLTLALDAPMRVESTAWSEEYRDKDEDYCPIGDSVRVRVRVSEQGKLEGIRLPGSPTGCDWSAMEWVRSWRFTPATRGGQPVASWADVIVHVPPSPKPR